MLETENKEKMLDHKCILHKTTGDYVLHTFVTNLLSNAN